MSTYILIFFPNIFYGKESKAESRIGNGMDGITEIFFDDYPIFFWNNIGSTADAS